MQDLNISPRDERKRLRSIDPETRQAIARSCRYIHDDRKVLQYHTAPHEGITILDVALIRRREMSAGRIPCNSFSAHRRGRVF